MGRILFLHRSLPWGVIFLSDNFHLHRPHTTKHFCLVPYSDNSRDNFMKTDPNSFQIQEQTHEQLFGTPDDFHVITEHAVLANDDEINFINSVFSISHSRSTCNSSDPVTHMIPVLYTT